MRFLNLLSRLPDDERQRRARFAQFMGARAPNWGKARPDLVERERARRVSGCDSQRWALDMMSLGKDETCSSCSGIEARDRSKGRIAPLWDNSLFQPIWGRSNASSLLDKCFPRCPAHFSHPGLAAMPMPFEARSLQAMMAGNSEWAPRLRLRE